jgi:2-desacetyl-2-hydroxyethyl bacteriochlorophyllide A dehydrogenase
MNMQTMRSVLFVKPLEFHVEERPLPTLSEGDALVRVEYVAICGSDQVRFWDQADCPPQPVVLGHEFSGRIVSAPGMETLVPGQPVTVAPLFNCGVCEYCRSGRENMCVQRKRFGVSVDGALQEFVSVPGNRVYPLPDTIPLPEGALIEPLAVARHTVRMAGKPNGGNTLVLGAGAIGLFIAQIWRALGNDPVVIFDIDKKRLAIAEELGISIQASPPLETRFQTIFEATGSSQAFSSWLPTLAVGGRMVVVSKMVAPVTIDWIDLLRKEGQIITSRHFNLIDFEQALQLAGSGFVQLFPLIGGTVSIREFDEKQGKKVMEKAKEVLRLLVRVSQE